jgi:hypothetical protein
MASLFELLLPEPKESIPPEWESIPGLFKRFRNTASGMGVAVPLYAVTTGSLHG